MIQRIAILLVSDESGATILPKYNFFAPHFKKVSSIKKYHHFRCDSSQPGVVFVKEHADTEEESKEDSNKCEEGAYHHNCLHKIKVDTHILIT